jgi:hypothetical protein
VPGGWKFTGQELKITLIGCREQNDPVTLRSGFAFAKPARDLMPAFNFAGARF